MGRSLQQDGPEIINENNTSMKEMTIKECALTDMKSFVENINKSTPIQNFYDRQSIFITGGTGFIGKLLIEKLLRVCPGIICIYVLIRTKKGKNLLQRIDELVEDPLFATLREEQPKFQNRIIPIEGDCSFPNLGISKTDRNTLIREVSIVFNVAATVKFNEKMKSAIAINVQSLRDLISLSKEMMKLKTFVHVSTAFANCTHDLIGEKFYDSNLDAEQFIDLMNSLNEKLLDDITPQLIGTYPNTYVFTKSMAEIVVKKHVDSIPIGIFRPAIVVPTYREPVPGWIDNLYGPVGITISVLMGLMRVYYCDGSIKANLVPADLTVNGLIVSAWDIANNRRFIEMMLKYGKLIPFKKAVWYYSFTITKYRPIYLFCIFFLHLLPALIIDTIAVCVGKQPRLLGIYNKIHQMSDALSYFSTNEWMYINKKWNGLMKKLTSEDRKLFFCDIRELVWSDYFPTYFLGIRKYILKDPIETLPQALIKWQRLYWMHQSLKLVIVCGFLIFIWAVISKFV